MNKIKQWMDFLGKKNLIAICALVVLIIAIGVGIIISNNKTNKENDTNTEEAIDLQVEENTDDLEGGSIDISVFSSDDEKKEDTTQSDNKGGDGLQPGGDDESGKNEDNKNEDNKNEGSGSGAGFGQFF